MSTIERESLECFVCKQVSQQDILMSTSSFGAADLDLRPPQMRRSTMHLWVQECPHCGYVADSIDTPTTVNATILQQEEYVTCSGLSFTSSLAKRFYKQHMILLLQRDLDGAFYAALNAAWACDDCGDSKNAAHCRNLAIDLIDRIVAKGEGSDGLLLQKVDLLRRSFQFERLLQEFGQHQFADSDLQQVLQFQLQKARQKDANCYTLDMVWQQ